MRFTILSEDRFSVARAGRLETDHGPIETPIFMPVGTAASVKAIQQGELLEIVKAQIILANTYHLYLRPGTEVLVKAGGIHRFMGWDGPVLTDSGGYQVYSLSQMRKISEEGVEFRSHIDGSKHFFTPESATHIQHEIGADIIMAFDECTPWPCDRKYAESAMHLTHRWLDRCCSFHAAHESLYGYSQCLAPIVQGSTFEDLRLESCNYIGEKGLDINAIGGLSVGEPEEILYHMTEICCRNLPLEKPRYLMGVGTPANILECIALGVDMFDCVLPTRNARHGLLYTWEGIINIKNEKWKEDFGPVDKQSKSPLSRRHSKAYLRHLVMSKELLAAQIASLHNLCFFLELVGLAREKITRGEYLSWMKNVCPQLRTKL